MNEHFLRKHRFRRHKSDSDTTLLIIIFIFIILMLIVLGVFIYFNRTTLMKRFSIGPQMDLKVRYAKIANIGNENTKPLILFSINLNSLLIKSIKPVTLILLEKGVEPIVTSSGMKTFFKNGTIRPGTTRNSDWNGFVFGSGNIDFNKIFYFSSDTANKDTFYQIDFIESQEPPLLISLLLQEEARSSYRLELYNSSYQLLGSIILSQNYNDYGMYKYSVVDGKPILEWITREQALQLLQNNNS